MKSFKPNPWLVPQPVLIIGTYNKEGIPNAMNAAWGGQWDMNQVVISLGVHQTTDNLAEKSAFTLTFATAKTMVASDYVGMESGRKVANKIERTGWKVEKAPNVDAPLFKDFPLTFECRVKRKIDESDTGYYLVGEIVNILCDEACLDAEGNPDLSKMDLIAFDPIGHHYMKLGDILGKAFSIGLQLK